MEKKKDSARNIALKDITRSLRKGEVNYNYHAKTLLTFLKNEELNIQL